MRWLLLAIGKPKLPFARAGIDEYLGRLQVCATAEISFLKSPSAQLERSEGHLRVVLDERGEQITSRSLADKISAWEQSRVKSIAVLIGGADGHAVSLRAKADWCWSLSRLTLQLELALLLALEQLYRAYQIKGGGPYHRD